MKHYTTISQSKKLLELGLSPETSDMIYTMVNGRSTPFIRLEKIDELNELHDIPCWSLGALLEVMPKINNNPFELLGGPGNYVCGYTLKEGDYISYSGPTPIEAVYSMICWLLENNYLKTKSPLTP